MLPVSLTASRQGTLLSCPAVTWYAAYAGNLDARAVLGQAPHVSPARTGWLAGWRLTFGGRHRGWEGALATVVEDCESRESRVFVLLFDLTDAEERLLDSGEVAQLGLYRTIRVRAQSRDGDVLAWLYVLDDYEGGLPSARYLGVLADAAEAAGAPADYVSDLRARPCRPPGASSLG